MVAAPRSSVRPRRAAPAEDGAGDRSYRAAAAALGRGDYAAARAGVDAAREAYRRDGVSGREDQLGTLYASINAEEERAARAAQRRAEQEAEQARELLRRGKARVADQRIEAAADGGGATAERP